jgi:hypothetical protein
MNRLWGPGNIWPWNKYFVDVLALNTDLAALMYF